MNVFSDLLSEIKSLQLHLPYKSYIHDNIFRERNMFLPVRMYDAYALDISMLQYCIAYLIDFNRISCHDFFKLKNKDIKCQSNINVADIMWAKAM